MAAIQPTPEYRELENRADLDLTKTSKSRFLFLLGFFSLFLFFWACCGTLHTFSYQSNQDVKVPESATYDPKYRVD